MEQELKPKQSLCNSSFRLCGDKVSNLRKSDRLHVSITQTQITCSRCTFSEPWKKGDCYGCEVWQFFRSIKPHWAPVYFCRWKPRRTRAERAKTREVQKQNKFSDMKPEAKEALRADGVSWSIFCRTQGKDFQTAAETQGIPANRKEGRRLRCQSKRRTNHQSACTPLFLLSNRGEACGAALCELCEREVHLHGTAEDSDLWGVNGARRRCIQKHISPWNSASWTDFIMDFKSLTNHYHSNSAL